MMENVKKLFLWLVVVTLIASMCLSLTACGDNETSEEKVVITQPNTTEVAEIEYKLEDLVADARRETYVFSSGSHTYVIPEILINSNDAQTVNREILNKNTPHFDEMDQLSAGGTFAGNPTVMDIEYEAYLVDGILSVCIARHMSMSSEYDVYNFEVSTGECLDNETFCAEVGKNYADIKDQVKAEIEKYYEQYNSNSDASYQSWKQENLNYSLSDENLAFVKVYYEGEEVKVTYRVKGMAGASYYYNTFDADDVAVIEDSNDTPVQEESAEPATISSDEAAKLAFDKFGGGDGIQVVYDKTVEYNGEDYYLINIKWRVDDGGGMYHYSHIGYMIVSMDGTEILDADYGNGQVYVN